MRAYARKLALSTKSCVAPCCGAMVAGPRRKHACTVVVTKSHNKKRSSVRKWPSGLSPSGAGESDRGVAAGGWLHVGGRPGASLQRFSAGRRSGWRAGSVVAHPEIAEGGGSNRQNQNEQSVSRHGVLPGREGRASLGKWRGPDRRTIPKGRRPPAISANFPCAATRRDRVFRQSPGRIDTRRGEIYTIPERR